MADSFYAPGAQRAEKVNALFAAIASRYDVINDVQSFGLHRWWKRRLIRLARVQSGDRALDVCCGTGDLAFALAGQGARVTGLDFSEPMLKVASARREKLAGKIDRAGEVNPRFVHGDALHLPFPDESFEIVTVAYGLRNLADWGAGLREMRRVACRGGRLLVLEFGKPGIALWRGLYFGYLRMIVPVWGQLFCGNAAAYAYILESLREYPAQHGVAARMKEMGLGEVRVLNLLGGVMSIHCAKKPT